jgi:hypothetical protein
MKRNTIVLNLVRLGIALVLATGVATQVMAQNRDADKDRAVALWEKAILAKGGRERLHAVENLLISSAKHVHIPGAYGVVRTTDTESERLYVMPEKAWIYELTPQFDVSLEAKLINFEQNFCAVTLAPARGGVPGLSHCLPTTPFEYLVQHPVIYLMETKWVRPVPLSVRVERQGLSQVEVIETQIGKIRADFYLDRKTKLPNKIITPRLPGLWELLGPTSLITIELDHYKSIDGILMPQRVTEITERADTIERRLDIEDASYSFNVSYNPEIFHDPIPPKVKRKDWKQLTSHRDGQTPNNLKTLRQFPR